MTGDIEPGTGSLDERSVTLYNAGDARLMLSREGELRIQTDDHDPLLCKFTERGICVWDRVNKKECLIPWPVIVEIGAAVAIICRS
jgi:hypothetical protein